MPDGHFFSRRETLALGASLALAGNARAQTPLLTRPIPQGRGESVPIVGLGTSEVFDVGATPQDRAGPSETVHALAAGDGTIIDTAPSYGEAERVIGDIVAAGNLHPRPFIATKLEYYRRGRMAAEARECLSRLKTAKLDLLQLHNVTDPNQDMAELGALKAQGVCRYTGVTTTYDSAYGAIEAITRHTRPDFLEIDYAIDNREAEKRILPAAADAGTAVLVALPFGRGDLFRNTRGKTLPGLAAEIDCTSWAQFFLKFLLGHPAVTAVIPGTDKAVHMRDNLGAGHGRMPDAKDRARMVQIVEAL